MSFRPDQETVNKLITVYGKNVPQYLSDIATDHPTLGFDQVVDVYKKEPTSTQSSFCREPNVRALAWLIGQDKSKDWRILSAGCGKGPEPYELAMHLALNGSSNFKIDGFDVSEDVVKDAKKGAFPYSRGLHGSYFMSQLFPPMIEAGILLKTGSEYERFGTKYIDYEANPQVKARLNFSTHDFIDRPVLLEQQKVYDVAVCNNVLLHYPIATREVILHNLLANLKDGGILALEHNELLGGIGSTPERIEWLRPYYQWKANLEKFGLQRDSIDGAGFFIPPTVYRFNQIQLALV